MAQRTITTLLDDIDGSEAVITTTFGLDGRTFEIDLSEHNLDRLHGILEEFVPYARKVGRPKPASKPSTSTSIRYLPAAQRQAAREQNQAIRDWARNHGHQVADIGRIPMDIVAAFDQAHASPRALAAVPNPAPTPPPAPVPAFSAPDRPATTLPKRVVAARKPAGSSITRRTTRRSTTAT